MKEREEEKEEAGIKYIKNPEEEGIKSLNNEVEKKRKAGKRSKNVRI